MPRQGTVYLTQCLAKALCLLNLTHCLAKAPCLLNLMQSRPSTGPTTQERAGALSTWLASVSPSLTSASAAHVLVPYVHHLHPECAAKSVSHHYHHVPCWTGWAATASTGLHICLGCPGSMDDIRPRYRPRSRSISNLWMIYGHATALGHVA